MKESNYKLGITAALFCAITWGILPIYWKSLIPINSFVIIFYRIFTVGVFSFIGAYKLYGMERIKAPLKKKGTKPKFFIAGLIITLNWSIYIWAINAGFVIQTSIGYYMEPLVVCLFGIVFFKEKFTKYRLLAFIAATIGVLIMVIHFNEVPTIALGLSFTFASYAALKKSFNIEALLSLLYETMFLSPIALIVIIYLEINGKGALGVGELYQYILLLFTGLMTVIPLALFAVAANNLPLITLGITEYISPSMALLLGVFVYREPFDSIQFIGFCVIWIGLVLFTIGEAKEQRKIKENLHLL